MRAMILAVAALAMGAGASAETEKQIWACRTGHEHAEPIIHLVEWDSRSYVKFAHFRFGAEYQAGEDSQGWYFNNDGSGYYRYAMVLEHDGRAWLHHFSRTDGGSQSNALDYFKCQKTS